jgi:hypothetical protein
MAGTRRIPIARQYTTPSITERAVELFVEMKALVCTCPPINWDRYWERKCCAACDKWWSLHGQLHRELGCRLEQWPAVEHPLSTSPYPTGSAADKAWRPDERGRELWRLLEQAAVTPQPAS